MAARPSATRPFTAVPPLPAARCHTASTRHGFTGLACPRQLTAQRHSSTFSSSHGRDRALHITRATPQGQPAPDSGNNNLIASIGFAALWAGLVGYAFFLSPNQTPARDMLFLERLVNLKTDADVTVNSVFYGIFNIMGIYPALYACLLIPAARSENKVCAQLAGWSMCCCCSAAAAACTW